MRPNLGRWPIERMRLPELGAVPGVTDERARSPNRKFLIRAFEEALASSRRTQLSSSRRSPSRARRTPGTTRTRRRRRKRDARTLGERIAREGRFASMTDEELQAR